MNLDHGEPSQPVQETQLNHLALDTKTKLYQQLPRK